jgi:hypothetical protein
MQRTPPLLPELWDQIPPMGQTALLAIMEVAERRIALLEREVAELKEQRRNSQNSSQPPSSTVPAATKYYGHSDRQRRHDNPRGCIRLSFRVTSIGIRINFGVSGKF